MAELCDRLKLLRNERRLKQREMAEQFDLALNSYQAYFIASFFVSATANVAAYYICKWLDRHSRGS